MRDVAAESPRPRGQMDDSVNFVVRACLLAALTASTALAMAQKQSQEPPAPWLPSAELTLFERSFARCLKARREPFVGRMSDQQVAAALSNDLDALSGSITTDDVRKAPTELVGGVTFIRCGWLANPTSPPSR